MSKVFYILAGVAIGMLIAPDKGSNTRAKLSSRLNSFTEDADEFANDAALAVKNRADHFQERLFEKTDQFGQKINEEF